MSGDISNFTKAVSATASVLLNNATNNELLSSESAYKKMLHDTIKQSENTLNNSIILLKKTRPREKKSTFLDLYNSENGKGYFSIDGKKSSDKTNFRVMSYISDDLLNDIPTDNETEVERKISKHQNLLSDAAPETESIDNGSDEPSLFQGFQATVVGPLASVDMETRTVNESGSGILFIDSTSHTEYSLPQGFNLETLKETYSLKNLETGKNKLTTHLSLLEVQKKLAAKEIDELDAKIRQLNEMRGLVFQRVAKIEENEKFIEKNMSVVVERINMVKEYNLDEESVSSSHNNDNVDGSTTTTITTTTTSSANELELQKLDKEIENRKISNLSTKTPHEITSKNAYKRKIQPTLQNYYKPNSLIHSFDHIMNNSINALDFDVPFGTMCCAGEAEPVIQVWDLQSHEHKGDLTGHLASITCMEMDESLLISGSRDAQIKIWDFENLECLETLDSHVDEITAISFDGETVVSGSQDRTLRQWDIKTGKCVQTIDMNFIRGRSSKSLRTSAVLTHEPPVVGALQVYDAALATGTKDGIVRLWDMRSAQIVRTLEGHTDCVTSLKFDSINLVTGSLDTTCRIWDLRMGVLADLIKFDDPVTDIDLDSTKIVVNLENHKRSKVYDRKLRELLDYSDTTNNGGNDNNGAKYVTSIKYNNGYLLEGYTDGSVNSLAV